MMKTKKLLAFLLASAMMCTAFTACGDKEDSSKEESSAAETTAEESSEEETSRQLFQVLSTKLLHLLYLQVIHQCLRLQQKFYIPTCQQA